MENKNPFWDFSCELYKKPEIEKICLEAQNKFNCNINILLFCCWLGLQNKTLNKENLMAIIKSLESWQNIIEQIRNARHAIKKYQQDHKNIQKIETIIYPNIRQLELNCERHCQDQIFKFYDNKQDAFCDHENDFLATVNNLSEYWQLLSSMTTRSPKKSIQIDWLSTLLTTIFSKIDHSKIHSTLKSYLKL